MICQYCSSINLIKRGTRNSKKSQAIRYECKDCGRYTPQYFGTNVSAKILLFDIETALMEVYVFSLRHNDYISPKSIKKDFSVLCWSAKWLMDDVIYGEKVTPEEALAREDKRILQEMWRLLDEADVVVVQNGKKFDIPKLNTRFLKAGFPPPMYYQVVDTKEVMSRYFGNSSNSLDYANKFYGLEGKTETEFEDWIRCVEGGQVAQDALTKMLNYNKDDVKIMEELYLTLRPWIPSHANLGIYSDVDKDVCPNCQSTELKWTGQYSTPLGRYEAFRCQSCGAIGRSTKKVHRIKAVEVRN